MISQIHSAIKNGLLKITHGKLSEAFLIKSDLSTEERIVLYKLALGRKSIIEIGSYIGASACCFGAAMKESGVGRVYCIDTWNNDAMTEGSRDTYAEFLKNTAAFEQFIVPIRGFSTEVIDLICTKIDHIDMIFIDGDHSYQGVKSDWDRYKVFLKTGSVIVFHDWGWAEGVKKVIGEEVAPLVRSFRSLPNMWWGLIK